MRILSRLGAAFLLLATFASAQAYLPPPEKFCRFDSDGFPLIGGKLYAYVAGSTTDKATYTDDTGGSENDNPVVLDSSGCANVWLGSGSYKFVLTDTNDVQLWEVDNITAAPPVWGSITGTLADQTDLQAALDAKIPLTYLDTDVTLAANSNVKIATQKAVKAYATPQTRSIVGTAPITVNGTTSADLSGTLTIACTTLVGDSGSGGSKGCPVAPSSGDAAANKYLKADGTWAVVAAGGIGIQKARSTSICTTGSSSYDVCTTTLTWPATFANTNYAVACSGVTPGGGANPAATLNVYSKSTTQVVVQVQTQRSQTATYTEVDCVGIN